MLADLSSYSLGDFIPLNPEIYARLFERVNDTADPWQYVFMLLGVFVLVCVWRQWQAWALRMGALLLLSSAYFFHFDLFRELTWMATMFVAVFVIQALILASLSLHKSAFRPGLSRLELFLALLFVSAALFVSPVLTLLPSDYPNAPMFIGLAPDPTILATFALAWSVTRLAWLLLPLTLLWLLVSALLSRETGVQFGSVYLSLAVAFLAVQPFIVWHCRRSSGC